jgi:O-antigen/teichoic acid export membrane protein
MRRIKSLINRDGTRTVIGTIALKVASGIVAFAMFSLAARNMSTAEFGHLAMWLSVAQIGCVIGLFGQEMLLIRSLGEYAVAKQPGHTKGILLFSNGIALGLSLLASIAVVAFAGLVRHDSPALMLAVALFMISNAAIMLGSQVARSLVGILMGEGSRDLFWRLVVALVLLVTLVSHRGISPEEFLYLSAAAMALGLIAQAVGIWRALSGEIRRSQPVFETRRWTKASLRFWLSSILEASSQYFDVVVVYWLLDPAAAGIYFAASRLANVFAMLLSALNSFAFRRLPALYFAGARAEIDRNLALMAEVSAVCVAIGLMIFSFGAAELLGLFGASFVAYKWTLIVLAIGTAVQSAGGTAPSILQLTGHEGIYVPMVAGNVALRLLGFLILIPPFGVLGAAVACTVSLVITTVALNWLCRHRTGLDPSIFILLRRFGGGRDPKNTAPVHSSPSPPAKTGGPVSQSVHVQSQKFWDTGGSPDQVGR